jgi:hypothetical protein
VLNTASPAPPAYVALLLVRWRTRSLLWGLKRLVLGSRGVRAFGPVPGLRFAKVLGSGRGGGFGIVPGVHHQGLIAFFDEQAQASAFLQGSALVQHYQTHAEELLVALARTTSSRGSWAGAQLGPASAGPDAVSTAASGGVSAPGPLAALTRAAIRPSRAWAFWRQTPSTEASLAHSPGCRLAVGLGEAPLLRQATFSLWDSAEAMAAFSRQNAHGQASQRAWREGWFSEWMFARLEVLALHGRWRGQQHG